MKRLWIGLIAAAVILTGGFFLYNRSRPSSVTDVKGSSEIIKQFGTSEALIPKSSVPVAVKKTDSDALKKYEEKLRSEGYTDDPNDPYNLIKKIKHADGKVVTHLMPKDPKDNLYFEPQDRDARTAEEILDRKKDLNPSEEMSSLKRINDKDQNSAMLLGHFRDEANDLEIFFSPLLDDKDNVTEQDMTCLVAPRLNLNFRKKVSGQAGTDDTGYALVKFDDKTYVRVAWSWAYSGRLLHGQIFSVKDGNSQMIKKFDALEVHEKPLKYCQ